MKYIAIQKIRGEEFTREFGLITEAVDWAEYEWKHLCDEDKKHTEAFYILESVNPDEDAEDHYDGDIVWHETLEGYEKAEEDEEGEEISHLTTEEARDLALDLDWGNPYDDPDDFIDCLRTNWETQLDEDSVQLVYECMCEIWDDKHEED